MLLSLLCYIVYVLIILRSICKILSIVDSVHCVIYPSLRFVFDLLNHTYWFTTFKRL